MVCVLVYRECCAPGIARPWINPCIFNLVQLHDEVRSPPRRQRTVAGAAEQTEEISKEASTRTDNRQPDIYLKKRSK